jgi:hypothetical protein
VYAASTSSDSRAPPLPRRTQQQPSPPLVSINLRTLLLNCFCFVFWFCFSVYQYPISALTLASNRGPTMTGFEHLMDEKNSRCQLPHTSHITPVFGSNIKFVVFFRKSHTSAPLAFVNAIMSYLGPMALIDFKNGVLESVIAGLGWLDCK